jgi:hypothetical protein
MVLLPDRGDDDGVEDMRVSPVTTFTAHFRKLLGNRYFRVHSGARTQCADDGDTGDSGDVHTQTIS